MLPVLRVAGVVALTIVVTAVAVEAQDARAVGEEVAAAHADAVAAAAALKQDLVSLVPSVAGWTCEAVDRPDDAVRRWMSAIPSAEMRCTHRDQSLAISVIFDRPSAAAICRSIAPTRQRIETGRLAADLLRFVESPDWRVMRSGVDIEGCAAGRIAFDARGDRSEPALARGPSAIDAFAEALVNSDPGAVIAKAETLGQEAALGRLVGALEALSRLLDGIIPTPPGATRTSVLPLGDLRLPRLPTSMILVESPGASVDLDVGGCRIMIALSASQYALEEATGARGWGRRRGEDGSVGGAYVRRNTARIVGRERVDGTGIDAVVDGSVVVSVVIPGNRPCESDPRIVRRLFDEIVANDLSVFAAP